MLVIGQAWLLSRSVVGVFETRSTDGLWTAGALLLAVFAARGLLAWLQSVLAHRASAAVKSQLRREVMAARLRRPTGDRASASTLVTVVTSGLDDLDGYFSKYLPQLALALVVPFLVGGAILWADWQSALIVAFTLPLIPVFMALVGWTTAKATARRFAVLDRLANHFADLVEGLPTLQAFGRARAQAKGVAITEDANRRETMRVLYVSFLSAFVLELLATLSVAVVAVTVGFRLVFGHVDFTTALFVLILAPDAFLPVRQVGVHYHDSADGVAAADAAFAIIDAAGDEPDGTLPAPNLATSRVRFEGAGFTHPGADRASLEPLDLTLHPGEMVALSGASGAGKTTALRLLMGFEQPTVGRLVVESDEAGALDRGSLDPASWREQLAFVPQLPGLVPGSVADNVRLAAPEAGIDEVEQVLTEVGADFSAHQTVGDDGEGLSAGQLRRVALARALLRLRRGARLLVLDEPTAGLDADSEATVLEAVRATGAGALIVTHRPAALALADRVVELEAVAR
ncbi:thiol reductant ABC exporter subunit CydD [Aestuariimicrobium ganziense]|uniref:thiol reductant ABC exporter subunit CydD n=1 Tax=Aestuariimicrobium ganziense TaxID=2773677 RepID=UPI001F32F588